MTHKDPPPVAVLAATLAKHPDAHPVFAARDAYRLCSIGRRLQAIATRQCNGYPHPSGWDATAEARDKRAWSRLASEAAEMVKRYGCHVATQGDPRGAVLRLVHDGRETAVY